MKKITAIILALMIALSCGANAFAAETGKKNTDADLVNIETGTGNGKSAREMIEKYPEAAEYIANELMYNYRSYYNNIVVRGERRYLGSEIYVDSYNIPRSEGAALYQAVVNEYFGLVHVNPIYEKDDDYNYNYIVFYRPTFLFRTADEAEAAIKKAEKSVRKLISGVKDSWDDFHKALYLHDTLATQTEYVDTNDNIEHAAYGALVNGEAVCQGYSHAYGLLLKRCGIKSSVVTSNQMGHEWNIVKVNGNFYHVDVTWDDPTYDTLGYVRHEYFLLSDSAINDPDYADEDTDDGHYLWNAVDADDTTYDSGMWWRDLKTAIYYDSDREVEYYVKPYNNFFGKIMERDVNTGDETELYLVKDPWFLKDGGEIDNQHAWSNNTKLSYYEGYLYFNTPSTIYRMKPGEAPEEVFTKDDFYDIFGFRITPDGHLNYSINENPNVPDVIYTYDLKSGADRLIDTELEIDAGDTNFALFGIEEPASGYNGLNLLGIQKKSADENDSMRFISLISSEVLKNAREYGYVFTATSKSTDIAKQNAGKLTIENGHKYDCTGTLNSMTGEYGSADLDGSSYKYVTAAMNNITGDKAVVARLYVIDNDGFTHYGTYIDSSDVKWDGCAARLSELG